MANRKNRRNRNRVRYGSPLPANWMDGCHANGMVPLEQYLSQTQGPIGLGFWDSVFETPLRPVSARKLGQDGQRFWDRKGSGRGHRVDAAKRRREGIKAKFAFVEDDAQQVLRAEAQRQSRSIAAFWAPRLKTARGHEITEAKLREQIVAAVLEQGDISCFDVTIDGKPLALVMAMELHDLRRRPYTLLTPSKVKVGALPQQRFAHAA